jgi:hypothetical protein
MNLANLKMTREERQILEWCYDNLDDEQAAEIEYEAIEFAAKEVNAPEAAAKLISALVPILIRNAENEENWNE